MSKEFKGPEKAQFPLQPLAGMEPLHSGMRRAGRVPAQHATPILESCRCDQESFQDANLIRQALVKAQRSERYAAEEGTLKHAALMFVPIAFFIGILISSSIFASRKMIPMNLFEDVVIGFMVAIGATAAVSASKVGWMLLERLRDRCGRGLW